MIRAVEEEEEGTPPHLTVEQHEALWQRLRAELSEAGQGDLQTLDAYHGLDNCIYFKAGYITGFEMAQAMLRGGVR